MKHEQIEGLPSHNVKCMPLLHEANLFCIDLVDCEYIDLLSGEFVLVESLFLFILDRSDQGHEHARALNQNPRNVSKGQLAKGPHSSMVLKSLL